MEQFSLEKYLENPSRKIVTRDGREVEIFYNNSDKTLLVGRISSTEIHQYTKDGFQYEMMCQAKNDLFFADEEELTEFEQKLVEIVKSEGAPIGNLENFTDKDKEAIHCYSKQLLDLARKEIRKEQQEKLGTLEMPIDVTEPYYIKGKQDALKDLPKWKKAKKDEELDCHVAIQQDDRVVLSDFVQKDEYYITLDVLKKLQKEE